jgi:hypothetical protein
VRLCDIVRAIHHSGKRAWRDANRTISSCSQRCHGQSAISILLQARQPNTAYVEFANITLTVARQRAGPQPIHGVVEKCGGRSGGEQQDCEVAVVP